MGKVDWHNLLEQFPHVSTTNFAKVVFSSKIFKRENSKLIFFTAETRFWYHDLSLQSNHVCIVYAWIGHRWIVNRWIMYYEVAQPAFILYSWRWQHASMISDVHAFWLWKLFRLIKENKKIIGTCFEYRPIFRHFEFSDDVIN